jgi:hypothetical protein
MSTRQPSTQRSLQPSTPRHYPTASLTASSSSPTVCYSSPPQPAVTPHSNEPLGFKPLSTHPTSHIALARRPSILSPQPSALSPQLPALNPQPSTSQLLSQSLCTEPVSGFRPKISPEPWVIYFVITFGTCAVSGACSIMTEVILPEPSAP